MLQREQIMRGKEHWPPKCVVRPPFSLLTCLAITQQRLVKSPRDPGVVSLHVNAGHFSTTARRVTSPTWGPPSPCKQAIKRFEDLVGKVISPVIFNTNRSFNQIIVNQNCYGAPLTFSYFFFKKYFCDSPARVTQNILSSQLKTRRRRPCQKSYISGYIWHKSFIQTVKCSFFNKIIVYRSFYGAPLAFS